LSVRVAVLAAVIGSIGCRDLATDGVSSAASSGPGAPPVGSAVPPRRAVTLTPGLVQVGPGIPGEVVTRIVRQSFPRVRVCWEKAPQPGDLELHVLFTIGPTGAVTTTRLAAAGVDAAFSGCVLAVIAGLTFPHDGGGPVPVDYPIVFHPAT
jgi:hypothetical protein